MKIKNTDAFVAVMALVAFNHINAFSYGIWAASFVYALCRIAERRMTRHE